MGPHHIENFRMCEYRRVHEGGLATGCMVGRASFCGPEQGRPCHFGMTFGDFPVNAVEPATDTPARVLEWREFAAHMEAYIAENTVAKYGDVGSGGEGGKAQEVRAYGRGAGLAGSADGEVQGEQGC